MKVAVFQYDIIWEDPELNKKKVMSKIPELEAERVDWLVFPEASLTGFSMDPLKSELAKEYHDFFRELAVKLDTHISYGAFQGFYNKLITVAPNGALLNEYSKIHLFSFAGENKIYKSGNSTKTFLLKDLRVLPSICYDLRFAYLYWDEAPKMDLALNIASWPKLRSEHWISLLKARAIENQCFMLGVNRVGRDPRLEYSGNSMLIDPLGRVILDCGTEEGVYFTQIDKVVTADAREAYPFMKDRIKKP